MYPILFSLGPLTIHSYGITMALGFLAAGIVVYYGFKRKQLNTDSVVWLILLAAAGGLAGAKADYILVNLRDVSGDPASILSGAGLVWYGGVIGALLLTVPFVLIKKISLAKVFDAAAPAIAIGLAFGRIGCFLMGTCYGKPSTLPWAVAFPKGLLPTQPGVTVQPTQLYEMLASLAIFGFLMYLAPRLKRDWAMISLYMMLAGTVRFLNEFLRFNRDGQLQAQSIALTVAVTGAIIFIFVLRRSSRKNEKLVLEQANLV